MCVEGAAAEARATRGLPTSRGDVQENSAVLAGDRALRQLLIFAAALVLVLTSVTELARAADPLPPKPSTCRRDFPVGWLGAVTAMLGYGCSGACMKFGGLTVVPEGERSLLFNAFSPLGNAAFTGLLCGSMRLAGMGAADVAVPVGARVYAWFGAINMVAVQVVAFFAMQRLALAAGPTVWTSIGILSSFLWGTVFFREQVASQATALLGVFLLVAGLVLAMLAPSGVPDMIFVHHSAGPREGASGGEGARKYVVIGRPSSPRSSFTDVTGSLAEREDVEADPLSVQGGSPKTVTAGACGGEVRNYVVVGKASSPRSGQADRSPSRAEGRELEAVPLRAQRGEPEVTTRSFRSYVCGIILAVVVGLLDGGMLVPLKCFRNALEHAHGAYRVSYVFTFLELERLALLCLGLFLAMGHCATHLARQRREMSLSQGARAWGRVAGNVVVPGCLHGVLWASGNVGAVHAVEYLGIAVGFPLSQLALFVALALGLIHFGELSAPAQRLFVVAGATVAFTGSAALALSGGDAAE